MREIEVKAWVRDEASLRVALESKGIILGKPVRQRDEVYGTPGAYGGGGFTWLRIRTENDNKYIFTLKRTVTSGLDSIEHETEVADATELKLIFGELGYEPFTDITKTRQKAKYGEIEICLDIVDELGLFIEAERICEHETDKDAVIADLWDLLSSLGILREDEAFKGYDLLIEELKASKV